MDERDRVAAALEANERRDAERMIDKMHPKPEREKVRLLAERLNGWRWGARRAGGTLERWQGADGGAGSEWNPFTSRDDAHECLGKLTDVQWLWFATELLTIRSADDLPQDGIAWLVRAILTATPAQISEALVKVMEAQP